MRTKWNVLAGVLGLPGFLVQTAGIFRGDLWLVGAGTALLVAGLSISLMAARRNPVQALWGLAPIMGFIVCITSGEPDSRAYDRSAQARAFGGMPLLLLILPLAVLLLLFGDRLPGLTGPPLTQTAQDEAVEPPASRAALDSEEPEPQDKAPLPARESAGKDEGASEPAAQAQDGPESGEGEGEPVAPPATDEDVFAGDYEQLRTGMPYDRAVEIMGSFGEAVAGGGASKVVRWRTSAGSYFLATFKDDSIGRITPLRMHTVRAALPASEEDSKDVARQTAAEAEEESAEEEDQPDAAAAAEEAVEDGEPETGQPQPRPPRKRVVGVHAKDEAPKGRIYKKPRLPRFGQSLRRGPHDVHILNDNNFAISVGLRSGKRGKDFSLRPGGAALFYMPNGDYTIHYMRSEDPDEVHSAGGFTVDSPTEGIFIHVGARQ